MYPATVDVGKQPMSTLQAWPAHQGFQRHLVAIWSICVTGGHRRFAPDIEVQKKRVGALQSWPKKSTVHLISLQLANVHSLKTGWGFLTQFSSCSLSRLTLLWRQRSATSPRCSRTATKTRLTSSLSRCRTRPPPQQPLKLDSKTIASLPIGVHL